MRRSAKAPSRIINCPHPLNRFQDRRLAPRVDPSDVVQEALTQAYRDLGRFRGGTEAEGLAWLRALVALKGQLGEPS